MGGTMGELKKPSRSRFLRHANILIWKCYLQRQRRWRILVAEAVFAGVLFLLAVYQAKPVFLTPLQAEPEPPLNAADILASLNINNILGFAPNIQPYRKIMKRVAALLKTEVINAETEDDLNNILYNKSRGTPINLPVIWVIWSVKDGNKWHIVLRSTERARYNTIRETTVHSNPHLRAGCLAVQLAISQAIIDYSTTTTAKYELSLVSMPVSPLMQEAKVRKVLSQILLCFTLALIPPVLETQALVVTETLTKFKRALCIRNVSYSSIYVGWLVYAYLTALPICLLASITIILIFRWIHLVVALILMLAYVSVMIMLAFIMALFHKKAWIACVWNTLFTILQMYLAELLVHHQYDLKHGALTFVLHLIIPPLGLVHSFNQFALLQIGNTKDSHHLFYTIASWSLLFIAYFGVLMFLQRTIGQDRAIGGQVSWKSIIFKKTKKVNNLNHIEVPSVKEREKLQEVDELVAKAISFNLVSKSIMGVPIISDVTLNIYRKEFTILLSDRIQSKLMNTIDDLLTGLTQPDKGTVNVLGQGLEPGRYFMTEPYMLGYCHRSNTLIDDLSVDENFTLFTEICLWSESSQYVTEYGQIRSNHLFNDCDLECVKNERVANLDNYYKAQLCWAIALLMEPRIVIIPNFSDSPNYTAVIKDKIMQYKQFLTIIKFTFSSIQLEYADRVFLFDRQVLVFGGTPAYMFFKYGREYHVRMTLRCDGTDDDEGKIELLERAKAAGATVRAHLGSVLILRLPSSPTANVADLIKDLTINANKYGMTSLNISLPDPDEVCRRAKYDTREISPQESTRDNEISKRALKRISESPQWRRVNSTFGNVTILRHIGWKYFSFYVHYRLFLIITVLSAICAGILIGVTLSTTLMHLLDDHMAANTFHGELLTVEALEQQTTLVLRSDNSSEAQSIAHALVSQIKSLMFTVRTLNYLFSYVLSESGVTKEVTEKLTYTALSNIESLTEYLVTRAVDSPQHYVFIYAYGMDVSTDDRGILNVQALYSPLHRDVAAASRSLARVHMALLRHYTKTYDATIQFIDDPLVLDLSSWEKFSATPPLLLQFLLILTISHITLIPSKENGLIRHLQSHAMNFSPARYWFTLYFFDLILYWIIVALMTLVAVGIMHFIVPNSYFQYEDLFVLPFTLIIYGFGCVPQAYLFSLGRHVALNSMIFVIVNMVLSETTIVAKIFYGNAFNYALEFMSLSPQFNMAYAYIKIKRIFFYNSECIIFRTKSLCSSKILHKCCQKCGILQPCFSRESYLNKNTGVLMQITAMIYTAVVFMTVLLLLEYKVIQAVWKYLIRKFYTNESVTDILTPGAEKEKRNVLNKNEQVKLKTCEKGDTFGEYLLATKVCHRKMGIYTVDNVYLGLSKGQAVALSGLKRHGRVKLCEMLAGYTLPADGRIICMSKWNLEWQPHMYSRQISIACNRDALPSWMTVYDALNLIATLRGVPKEHVNEEISNYIEALELQDHVDTPICRMLPSDSSRLRFAAAVVGAPPVIILDECTAHQKVSVRRAMYSILFHLRRRGHAILVSSSSVESHMPVTSQLAIMIDGRIFDIDTIDDLVERYSNKGFTVVLHLKDEVDINTMFAKYFQKFKINDISEVLVNLQVQDRDLDWATVFERMETLKRENDQVYSYVVSAIPIDYIYNSIINMEKGPKVAADFFSCNFLKYFTFSPPMSPTQYKLDSLQQFDRKYHITKLKELPWSVIFKR